VLGLGEVQPTPEQLAEMERVTDQAMRQGALGVSSSLLYPPGSYARTAELVALARVAARHGGLYASHIRDEAGGAIASIDEAIAIGREAKVPVEIWHLKASGRENWGRMREIVARIEKARAEGVDVAADMYPYVAAANGLAASVPQWAQAGGTDAMIARFKDPVERRRIAAELWRSPMGQEKPDDILIASVTNPALRRWTGKRLGAVAREMGRSPEDALLDLVEADRGLTLVVRFLMSEDDVAFGLSRSWISFNTDAPGQAIDGPFAGQLTHPRAFGSMARLIGHYARDRKLFPVEEAIRKMTSLPAQRVGLWDRGLLRPGMAADVVILDEKRVRDPATFEAPLRYAEGIDVVVVNGAVVLDEGKLTAERPGRFLRRR